MTKRKREKKRGKREAREREGKTGKGKIKKKDIYKDKRGGEKLKIWEIGRDIWNMNINL